MRWLYAFECHDVHKMMLSKEDVSWPNWLSLDFTSLAIHHIKNVHSRTLRQMLSLTHGYVALQNSHFPKRMVWTMQYVAEQDMQYVAEQDMQYVAEQDIAWSDMLRHLTLTFPCLLLGA